MFTKLSSYKKKLYLLLLILFVSQIIIFNLAFKRTIDLKKQCEDLTTKIEFAKNSSVSVNKLKKRLSEIDGIIGSKNNLNTNFHEILLEKVLNFESKNKFLVRNVPKVHRIKDNNFTIETYIVEIESGYKDAVNLIYLIENQKYLGKIASVDFVHQKERINNTSKLIIKIYVQNIKQ